MFKPESPEGALIVPLSSSARLLWPLRSIAAATLVAPVLLFAYACWTNYDSIDHRTNERIERALDVIQEHALKALQTIERAIGETNEVLRGFSDDDIRANEARLSHRLRVIDDALPQMQSVWAFDARGHPLVSSTILPVPRTLNNSDRDYFRAQATEDAGTFIGDIVQARVGSLQFFVVSGRRPSKPDGSFDGVVGVTVQPEHFREFYARLSRGVADSFGLLRADGVFLARYPAVTEGSARLNQESSFLRDVRDRPEAGMFTVKSQLDAIERRIGYRKIAGYPVYVQAGIETATIWRELRQVLAGHLAFGVPATAIMFSLALYALRRTQRFEIEIGRRQAAEAALKQAQRLEAVGQLTGGVAHDFNNLLMVVSGNVDRLRNYPVADERQKRALDAISTAARRGADLTRQLLSFSRRQTHASTPIDLRRHLPQLQDMLGSSLRGDITINVRIGDHLWPVKVDLSELELAVLNIAVNARDAMPQGGGLTIDAQNVRLSEGNPLGLVGDFIAVSFSDTGNGISPDTLPRVFEPFFTTKDVSKGTGLGLSQVYGFAKQSGGTATISSQPGSGTTVTLYLPRTNELPEQVKEQLPQSLLVEQEKFRILLVEDNADVAEVTRAHLQELGCVVTHVSDAAAAQRALRDPQHGYELVLSDIVMPGALNGVDLARVIRREQRGKLPVLLTTGYSDYAQAASDEGFAILRKPYDQSQLREALARARVSGSDSLAS